MTRLIDIPDAPAVPGLVFRHFEGPQDFPAMVATANASSRADDVELVRTVADMERDYASFSHCDPSLDVAIAEIHGAMVGYVRGWWWQQGDGAVIHGQLGFVAPRWRRRGIGSALLRWLEARQRAVAAQTMPGAPAFFHAFVTATEQARIALLERAGYAPARHFFSMLRPHLNDIADFPLPAGTEVRPVEPHQYRTIWDAHMQAFAGHWGWTPVRERDFIQWQANDILFQPQLWQVAWDQATGEVAGQVRAYINHGWNRQFGHRRGWTEFITVAEPWRRRGLARALISRSLRLQREQGMRDSGLGVDSDNPHGASRIYEECGFRVTRRNTAWRKPLAG
jgi:mycothiol synthase